MRGIRIWHLAALALSVPLLAAAVPAGCTGGLNPNIRAALGEDAATGLPASNGFVVLGYFNYTGFPGVVTHTALPDGGLQATTYTEFLYPDKPFFSLWQCGLFLWELDIAGGQLAAVDATGQPQQISIEYDGGILGGNQLADPLECGTLVKANVRLVSPGEARIDIELIK